MALPAVVMMARYLRSSDDLVGIVCFMEISTRDKEHTPGRALLRVSIPKKEDNESQLREELLSVLLHDLRSPLGAIAVLSDLITTANQQGDCAHARQLQLLQEAVTRTQRLLDDAIEVQSVIRGTTTFNCTPVDLGGLVRACLEKVRHARYYRNGSIQLCMPEVPQLVQTDLEKAEAALLCVLEHALKACSPDSLLIRTRREGDYLTVHLQAAGQASSFANIFSDDMLPADVAEKPAPGLRGRLGTRRTGESRYSLSVCEKVLEQMGARLEMGDGTPRDFEIHLPVADEGSGSTRKSSY